jgi:hypothetical protein
MTGSSILAKFEIDSGGEELSRIPSDVPQLNDYDVLHRNVHPQTVFPLRFNLQRQVVCRQVLHTKIAIYNTEAL